MNVLVLAAAAALIIGVTAAFCLVVGYQLGKSHGYGIGHGDGLDRGRTLLHLEATGEVTS